jgi:hypothetical protein
MVLNYDSTKFFKSVSIYQSQNAHVVIHYRLLSSFHSTLFSVHNGIGF